MSRHPNSTSRIIRQMIYLSTFRVASQRDLVERAKMEREGYVLDTREGAAPAVPTRDELISKLEGEGYRGIILSIPRRKYQDSPRKNPHQHVSVYYLHREEKYSSRLQAAGG